MLKRYTAGKLSKSTDVKVSKKMEASPNETDLVEDDKAVIDQRTLDQMKDRWSGTLASVSLFSMIMGGKTVKVCWTVWLK